MILPATRVWLAAAFVLITSPLLAQKTAPAPIVYGGVTLADFTPLPQTDSTQAPAEYLCDYGTSKIEGGQGQFQVIFERTTRLRIHRKSGYRYATVRVPLYTRDGKVERLTRLRGTTYNLQDGRLVKTKLNPDALFREELDKNHLQYTFTMPDVREGSIVEFSYVINSDFVFNLQDWQFEHRIPVRWSEYRAFLPQFYIYKTITRGYLPFAVNEALTVPYFTTYTNPGVGLALGGERHIAAQAQQLRWAMKDVPAFRAEPFMTTPTDYLRSVHFELAGVNFDGTYRDLTGQWEGIWERLRTDEEFEAAITKPTPALLTQALALRQRFPTDTMARAAAVLALVQRSVVYNNEQRIYASQPLRRTLERHLGNSADVNLLLVQTLRAAGLPATPLLLSTRDHGLVQTSVPVISQFNYVAAHLKLPGRPDVLLDATEPQLPLGMLPERCLNGQGRLADASGRWVPLKAAGRYTDYRTAHLQLSSTGELTGTVRLEYGGYAAVAARRQIRQTSPASYLGQVSNHWQDWQPTKPQLLPDSLSRPVAVELNLQHTPAGADAALLYLPLLNLPDALPYDFRTENRIYPVNFGMAREHITIVTLTLPKGYIVQELPTKLAMEIPGGTGRYVYQVTQPTPGSVELSARLQLNRAEYSPEEYGALREMNRRIIAKQNEPLVLKRVP
ncbi:DUF3857 domain-containing protein [Hymenobacter cellulosivorans]|uniref:DUF3857 domain-containing protein n=1 Tax=Hymenobacter cellulosivorans TaxID=2932249 RepID=A0ABY4FEZ9_9BACT|nr:DUF3857 domain-containing protein [Hymenobacter cellulosivorans]UOQ55125.1 DUF3857 domain-containing protein [Hymenobacter cellulosivorans]